MSEGATTNVLLFLIVCLIFFFGSKISERLGKLIRMKGGKPPGE